MMRAGSSSTSKPSFKRTKHHHHHHEEDKISHLPEPILHKILSFLPTKDATKTSVLSKTWNSVWNSFPVLDFDQEYFFKEPARSKHPKSTFKKSVQEFCKYVDDSITRRRTDVSIQRFMLEVYFNNTGLKSRREDIKRWMDYAVRNNVEHLVLHYRNNTRSKKGWLYPLPTSSALFSAKSLKELDLFGCKFVQSGVYQFQLSLKKLTLTHVDIDDRTLQSLLSNCGSLEELTIEQCSGFQSVNLSSHKLETVKFYLQRFQVQKVVIEAPNLRSLSYGGDCANVMRSLEVSNFNKNLTELKFHSGITITDAIITRVTREFRFLEKIELNWCHLQGNIRLSELGMGDRTIIRLNNGELIADCRNCYYEKSPRDIPRGFYKLEL